MNTYNSTDTILSQIVQSIVTTANPDKIILFGSRATGKENKDSDYDICVLKKNIKNRSKFVGKIYLNLNVMASVDVLAITPSRYEEVKNKWWFVYNDVNKYGKIIYEKK